MRQVALDDRGALTTRSRSHERREVFVRSSGRSREHVSVMGALSKLMGLSTPGKRHPVGGHLQRVIIPALIRLRQKA